MSSKIEAYGLIGDCRTAALVNQEGAIEWLCWPNFDSDACFASLLGTKENGYWQIAPAAAVTKCSRRYLEDTLILETTFTTAEGTVVLTDFMTGGNTSSDIVRIVRGVSGTVRMSMQLVIRFGMGVDIPWVRRSEDGSLVAIAGPDMAVLRTIVPTAGKDLTTVAEFEISAEETASFVLSYGPSHLEVPGPVDAEESLRKTTAFWREWISPNDYEGPYRDVVRRSLLTLKALTFAPTGGIVAAPTTSLPERFGGESNWDYRYCWLRDATFTLLALMNSGFDTEALAWHNWLLRAAAGAPADMQIMYGIDGRRRLLEWEASWLAGYENAQPVRVGNAAHAQLQLDVFGELMDVFHQARVAELKLDAGTWDLECALLDHLSGVWQQPDCGMWERRDAPQHYVSSKALVWVAFDRGIKSAEMFGLSAPIERWKAIREKIHHEVCTKGFDAERSTFVEAYGSSLLDASVLLLPAVGFLPADDHRIVGTLAAVEKFLMQDELVLRHDPRALREKSRLPEGAFLACTLWLADAYVLSNQFDRADKLFQRVARLANDVGLLAEEWSLAHERQAGNFPQALTHIALVNTAHNLSHARKPAVQRSETGTTPR